MDDRRTGLIDHRRGYLGLLFYPFYAIAARVLIRAKVRFLDMHIWALEDVGMLAMDLDTYLKEQVLSHRKVVPVLLCLGRKPANEALLAHWSKHIRVIRGRWINELLRPLMTFPELVDPIQAYSIVHGGAAANHGILSQWADRAPLLHLSADENARGEAQLRALGIPEGAWFVCVHSREGGSSPSTIGRITSGIPASWIMRRRCARSWRAAVGASAWAMRPCSLCLQCLGSWITRTPHRRATGWTCSFAPVAGSFLATPQDYTLSREFSVGRRHWPIRRRWLRHIRFFRAISPFQSCSWTRRGERFPLPRRSPT